jgi:hypothetical protein
MDRRKLVIARCRPGLVEWLCVRLCFSEATWLTAIWRENTAPAARELGDATPFADSIDRDVLAKDPRRVFDNLGKCNSLSTVEFMVTRRSIRIIENGLRKIMLNSAPRDR